MAEIINNQIGKETIQTVLNEASLMMDLFINLPGNPKPDRQGGYFTIVDRAIEQVLLVSRIGQIKTEEANNYLLFSQEKARRLMLSPDHISSWQSRDPKNDKWGGAIKTPEFILSFSGLPELGDEAVMLLTAWDLNWLKSAEVLLIAEKSSNHFVKALSHKLW